MSGVTTKGVCSGDTILGGDTMLGKPLKEVTSV